PSTMPSPTACPSLPAIRRHTARRSNIFRTASTASSCLRCRNLAPACCTVPRRESCAEVWPQALCAAATSLTFSAWSMHSTAAYAGPSSAPGRDASATACWKRDRDCARKGRRECAGCSGKEPRPAGRAAANDKIPSVAGSASSQVQGHDGRRDQAQPMDSAAGIEYDSQMARSLVDRYRDARGVPDKSELASGTPHAIRARAERELSRLAHPG